ncbi:hypothetical protein [Nocardioides jejuensis]|uniref:Uncharacterized protein n=1 Tax=Nocardioides jejuensis TaxID=2502782 RepID=A0A4R1CKL4_9ACTN|nr:hypothetical protein [Nocardioides jejuensis]TCJ30746.1 hypothetical protein EPD65_01540 [Nocardioides jejuensis]
MVALAAGLSWGGWTWTHPTVLRDTSALGNFDYAPQPVNESYWMGVAGAMHGSRQTVTLHGVRAHFASNTAAATATFWVCRTSVAVGAGSTRGGDQLGRMCSRLDPVHDEQRLVLAAETDHDQIVMKLVASKPGTAYVDRVDFTYTRDARHLWQHGTDTSEQDWRITAR